MTEDQMRAVVREELHSALQPMWSEFKAALQNINQKLDSLAYESTKQRKRLDLSKLEELRADVDAIKEHLGLR
jgi:predicted nuclease with TOPRIM domain